MIKKKITTAWLLKQYQKMSGEEKIHLGMELSEATRRFCRQGAKETHTRYGI